MASEKTETRSAASESAGNRRRLLQGALILLIVSLLAIGFWPDPVPVTVHEVADGPLAVTLREEGKTRFQERSLVSSPSAGWLSDIRVEGGDTVQAGDRLAVIRSAAGSIPDERQAEIAQARAEAARSVLAAALDRVELARRQLAFQQRERDRTQELLDSGIGTRQALEAVELALQQAQTALDTAESEVERARFEVRAAEAALSEPDPGASREQVIRSPADGVVLRVFDRRDRLVNLGEPILEVGEPGAIEVVADVRSSDAVSLRPGMAIRVRRWGGEGELEGRVTRVEPGGFTKVSALGVEEQRVNVVGELTGGLAGAGAEGSDPGVERAETGLLTSRLGDGYRVDLEFETWRGENVRQIPAASLFRLDGGWAVFVVGEGNRADQREIRIGHASGRFTQVLEGLEAGERVILNPDERIEQGVRVEPTGEGARD